MKYTHILASMLLGTGFLLLAIPVQAKKLQAPTILRSSERTTRSVYISWKNVPYSEASQFEKYQVKAKQGNNSVGSKEVTDKLDKKRAGYTFNRLKPNKRYTVKVRAVTSEGNSKWVKKQFRTERGKSNIASPRLIDMEAHITMSGDNATLENLTAAMESWNMSHLVLMSPPIAFEDFSNNGRASNIVDFVADSSDSISVLYGGTKLNPIILGLGDEATYTEEALYPNGTSGNDYSEYIAVLASMEDDAATWEQTFKGRARAAAESGEYPGFGEFAGLHHALRDNHPYMVAKLDQELMLWLSDLAAEYDMYIMVHADATTGKMQQIANLAAHNRNTKIVWTHPGWYTGDQAKPQQYITMLEENENLYYQIKLRESGVGTVAYPLKKNGDLRPKWRTLLKDYRDRIMISSDTKLWSDPDDDIIKMYRSDLQPIQKMLDQLPSGVAYDLAHGTAENLLDL